MKIEPIILGNITYTFEVDTQEQTITCYDENRSAVYKMFGYKDSDPLVCMMNKNCLRNSLFKAIIIKVESIVSNLYEID